MFSHYKNVQSDIRTINRLHVIIIDSMRTIENKIFDACQRSFMSVDVLRHSITCLFSFYCMTLNNVVYGCVADMLSCDIIHHCLLQQFIVIFVVRESHGFVLCLHAMQKFYHAIDFRNFWKLFLEEINLEAETRQCREMNSMCNVKKIQ